MHDTLALLLSDGYKQVHAEQFPKNTTKLVSYMTPRKSRLSSQDTMVFFGLQAFCKTYLIDYFNKNFFYRELDEVMEEYTRTLDNILGKGNYDDNKIVQLWMLGYLPLEIKAVKEGTKVPMHVPCVEITNTDPNFAWVVQWVESLLSSELWKPCVHANVGVSYRKIVDKYYNLTVDNTPHHKAMSDFGFRGMSCLQEAVKASAAWLLSFSGTATIPAIPYLEKMYNCDNSKELVGTNAISTEHSVMASNYSIDGDEITFIKRLLNEVYPNASFSMVSDTYDYWHLVKEILPLVKEDILNHNGKLLIRPDSGDIVDISIRTVECLWDIFGGSVNTKGYKVLDPHIGCVYGDGVTQERAERIYKALMDKGFASNNIVFGAGSFSFNCIEEDGVLNPYTRDTFSVAIKATYGIVDSKEIFIYKDPKTDRDTGEGFKKSQKGLCHVHYDFEAGVATGELSITFEDGLCRNSLENYAENHDGMVSENLLQTVFKNGRMIKEFSLHDIRKTLYGGDF